MAAHVLHATQGAPQVYPWAPLLHSAGECQAHAEYDLRLNGTRDSSNPFIYTDELPRRLADPLKGEVIGGDERASEIDPKVLQG